MYIMITGIRYPGEGGEQAIQGFRFEEALSGNPHHFKPTHKNSKYASTEDTVFKVMQYRLKDYPGKTYAYCMNGEIVEVQEVHRREGAYLRSVPDKKETNNLLKVNPIDDEEWSIGIVWSK